MFNAWHNTPITYFQIDANRTVSEVSCNCVYSRSKKCKHVAALIYFINNEESLSKTDTEQQWGKPSLRQLISDKYSKGKFFYEMRNKPKRPNSTSQACDDSDILKFKKPSALKLICVELNKDKDERVVQHLLSNMVNTIDMNLKLEDCRVCVDNLLIFVEEYPVYATIYELPTTLKDFYDNEIVLSNEDIVKLSCDTLDQSKCQSWFLARKTRISASKNAHNIKCRNKKSIASLLLEMLNDKKLDTKSTQYGISNENNARETYQRIYNVEVKQVGLISSVHQPWLCASLDGVVVVDGGIRKIVEFKCPHSCAEKPVINNETLNCNVSYLELRNGIICLKESHMYYTQCQIQLYLSGQSICDLFVWSPVDSCCVPIFRDEIFLQNVILKCEKFYFTYY